MARLPRYALPGHPQHVIQRGNNRAALFAGDHDYTVFRDCLLEACERHGCLIHAYVFMTNHVHLLVTPLGETAISKMMQSVGLSYVRHFNTSYRRTGTLWEGRYRATLVDTDRYFFSCSGYIELNPVRAGIVSHPRDYRWSSYRANALGRADRLITPHARYQELGTEGPSRREAYRALFAPGIDDRMLRAIRRATNHGWALGGARFRKEVAALAGRRCEPLPRGHRGVNGV
jgi:putative transposase